MPGGGRRFREPIRVGGPPYKHFTDKQALLTAVAVRELAGMTELMSRPPGEASAADALSRVLSGLVEWAMAHPARFHLVFGEWSTDSPELGDAAGASWTHLVGLVAAAQAAGELPEGEPERLTALIRSLAHGAITLALTGHLSKTGKGKATPEVLVADLLAHLRPRV